MPYERLAVPGLLTLLALAAGCMPKATFDVTIVNRTDGPITVGIVKEGEPREDHLAGPDQWAIDSPIESLPRWGHVIPAGRTMDSGPITGQFPRGALAYLRAYRGEHNIANLIAIGNSSPDRAEALLYPGPSQWVVLIDPSGVLRVQRVRAVTTAPTTR
jgi:hypothetical protein